MISLRLIHPPPSTPCRLAFLLHPRPIPPLRLQLQCFVLRTGHSCSDRRTAITFSQAEDAGEDLQEWPDDEQSKESAGKYKGWNMATKASWKYIKARCQKSLDNHDEQKVLVSSNIASGGNGDKMVQNFSSSARHHSDKGPVSWYFGQRVIKGAVIGFVLFTVGTSLHIWSRMMKLLTLVLHASLPWFLNILRTISKPSIPYPSQLSFISTAVNHQPLGLEVRPNLGNMSWIFSRIFYTLDILFERYPISYIFLLGSTCCILICIGGFLFYKFRSFNQALEDAFWDSWACICSSSTHLKERTRSERIVGLVLAVGGLLFYSLLISTMTTQFKSRMEWLSEGAHTQVMEKGHIIVCGMNNHLTTVLKQLNKAQELSIQDSKGLRRKPIVLLLNENSRRDMEKLISNVIKDCSQINILTRSGSLSSTQSFQRVAADKARQIIILATKDDGYEADAESVLSLLALQPLLEGFAGKVVVEVFNTSTAVLLKSYRGVKVSPVQNLSSKLFVQCSRQRGLIEVYRTLLDHSKQVINVRNYPSLVGTCYKDVRRGFSEAVVCGLLREGKVDFHPKDRLQLKVDDKLLIIAPKDTHRLPPKSLLALQPSICSIESSMKEDPSMERAISGRFPFSRRIQQLSKAAEWQVGPKERILMLGWRPGVSDMILEYDDYVGPGSELVILAETSLQERKVVLDRTIIKPLQNVHVTHRVGNPMSRADLRMAILETSGLGAKTLQAAAGPSQQNNQNLPLSIVAIAEKGWKAGDASRPDKQSVFSLILAEDICKEISVQVASLVAEFVDTNLGKQVVKIWPSLTYVGTDEITGLVTAQVTEEHELNEIWTELINSWGNEIYVKDIRRYLKLGDMASFAELSERAILQEEVAIGYRQGSKTVINPPLKSVPLSFKAGDSLVVISEFEYRQPE